MKTILLADHDLTVTDYSNFELKLHAKGAVCRAAVETYATEQGTQRARLTDASVEFDDTTTNEAAVEQICQVHGFQRRMP